MALIPLLGLWIATFQPFATAASDGLLEEHPRLWLARDSLPLFRSWAAPSNPVWPELRDLGDAARAEMDQERIPESDEGGGGWESYPAEKYAGLFAFLSLVHPEPALRLDYARRGRECLLHVIEAVDGAAEPSGPFLDNFATYDRSRWWGENFGLAVDWLQYHASPLPGDANAAVEILSQSDLAKIQRVFLRWCRENETAATTDFNSPEPGVYNNASLLQDPLAVRWSANNYYLAHLRNTALMAASVDSIDDPEGELRRYLDVAVGGRLFVVDHLLRGDARGGLSPEGWQYGPAALGYLAQTLLALHTAGRDDPSRSTLEFPGPTPQVAWEGHPFWEDVAPAFLHSLSPATVEHPWYGAIFQPAWFGDGQDYFAPDFIRLFGPLGLFDFYTNPAGERLEAIRWLQRNVPLGGSERFAERIRSPSEFFANSILYFLLYDPTAKPAADPREALPTDYLALGTGHLYSRTDWTTNAAFFTHDLSWNSIDHQLEEGNQFGYYRRGEWLTRGMVGWDGTVEPYGCNSGRSEFKNTLSIEQGPFPPGTDPPDFIELCRAEGSQADTAPADPRLVAHSFDSRYTYVTGDATALYDWSEVNNGTEPGPDNVVHCSRSIFWLKPDHVVVYDRVTTRNPGFVRFWLNAPSMPEVQPGSPENSTRAWVNTPGGQRMDVAVLRPAGAVVSVRAIPPTILQEQANDEAMDFQLRAAPAGLAERSDAGLETRFLVALQGVDGDEPGSAFEAIESVDGHPMEGAWIDGREAVLFPRDLREDAGGIESFSVAFSKRPGTVFVTGLNPEGAYAPAWRNTDGEWELSIRSGSGAHADAGGVLAVDTPSSGEGRPKIAIQLMGSREFRLEVEVAGDFVVQVSPDLTNWTEFYSGADRMETTQPISETVSSQYYRVVSTNP